MYRILAVSMFLYRVLDRQFAIGIAAMACLFARMHVVLTGEVMLIGRIAAGWKPRSSSGSSSRVAEVGLF